MRFLMARLVPALLATCALCACQGPVQTQSALPATTTVAHRANGAGGSSGAAGALLGCPYPSGDVWQTDISQVSPDPNSANYIGAELASYAKNAAGGFQTWNDTQTINSANNSTPIVPVKPGNSYDMPTVSAFPWQSGFFIQQDGDHHSLVLNTQSCQYYEGYKTLWFPSGNYLTMYNNTEVNLTQPFVRPPTGALSTATGIPLGMLAVRPEELNAGVIRHALGWNAVSNSINGIAGAPCVNPAGVKSCTDGNVYQGPASAIPMPYGSHARLKASFNVSGLPGRESKIVATAMQKYGLYVYDTGCCNVVIFTDDQFGKTTWTTQDAADLLTITPADFDIVPPPN